jgi:hypothetical protein
VNLPDAAIAHEGFFASHFFTVSDQDKSKDFYVRVLGGKGIKPDNPCYIKSSRNLGRNGPAQRHNRYHRLIVQSPPFCFDSAMQVQPESASRKRL